MDLHDTIIALATPQGKSALAVLRISGPRAFAIVAPSIVPAKKFAEMEARKIARYQFNSAETENSLIDEITAIKYLAPCSYTGEEMVEIISHGSPVIVEQILRTLLINGARYAGRGEFTRRAFLNGKMNLLRAEAVGDIIECESTRDSMRAFESYLGGYLPQLRRWKESLVNVISQIEARIEFPEEDDIDCRSGLVVYQKRIAEIYNEIGLEIKKRAEARVDERGLEVALIGPPNAGKSTLFNAIVGYDRALVHHTSGTTRDAISERIKTRKGAFTLIDTAGLGQSEEEVELLGMQRSLHFASHAGLVVWVTAANEETKDAEREQLMRMPIGRRIGIINKCDCGEIEGKEGLFAPEDIFIRSSLLTSESKREAASFVVAEAEKRLERIDVRCVLQNNRHERLARNMLAHLSRLDEREEMLVEQLKRAVGCIDELVGEVTSEEILDTIFSTFCIGK